MIPLVMGGLTLAFGLVVGAIKIFATALGWVGKRLAPLQGAFHAFGQLLGFLFGGPIIKGVGAVISGMGFGFRLLGGAIQLLAVPLGLVGKLFGWIGGLIGKVFGFIGRLIPGLGGLKNAFASAGTWIKTKFGDALLNVLTFLPKMGPKLLQFGIKLGEMFVKGLGNLGKRILGAFGSAVAWFGDIGRGIADWLNDKTPLGDKVNLPGPLPDFTLPALAGGGYITGGGLALVGEQGPEVVKLPTGSTVLPNRAARTQPLTAGSGSVGAGPAQESFQGLVVRAHMPVYLERRQIGEAMGDFVAEREARR